MREHQRRNGGRVPRGGAAVDGVLIGSLTPQAIDYAFADDGGVFTDETTPANEGTGGDVTLMPATEVINDAYYFGQTGKFCGIQIDMTAAGVSTGGGAAAITWEYWNGAAWVSLETAQFTDSSTGFTAGTGTYFVTFNPPSGWAQTTVNSQSAWWVRARCAVGDFTTTPTAAQVWILELNAGSGIRMPFDCEIRGVQAHATTASATNNDSVFLLVNVTAGTFAVFTWTKGDVMDRDATMTLSASVGDELALMLVQEDGTTEFADCGLILEAYLLAA